jgi:hypothetical protein
MTAIKEQAARKIKSSLVDWIPRASWEEVFVHRNGDKAYMANELSLGNTSALSSKHEVINSQEDKNRENDKDGNHGFTS